MSELHRERSRDRGEHLPSALPFPKMVAKASALLDQNQELCPGLPSLLAKEYRQGAEWEVARPGWGTGAHIRC